MSDPVRWTASLFVAWTPILTFQRRRSELLDWFERNVNISGFTEDDQHVGIEIARTQRVVVGRESLAIEQRTPDADAETLTHVLSGVFQTLEPEDAFPREYSSAWSAEIDGDFEERCQALATRVAPTPGGDLPMGATDCSVLVDFEAGDAFAQVEFGIVDRDDLLRRLQAPQGIGRLAARHEKHRPRAQVMESDLPALALFADVWLFDTTREAATSGEEIVYAVAEKEAGAGRLVAALKSGL